MWNYSKARHFHGEGIGPATSIAGSGAFSFAPFRMIFESQILWLENLDALLSEPVGVPLKPPD